VERCGACDKYSFIYCWDLQCGPPQSNEGRGPFTSFLAFAEGGRWKVEGALGCVASPANTTEEKCKIGRGQGLDVEKTSIGFNAALESGLGETH
jgi:hypothetical protein